MGQQSGHLAAEEHHLGLAVIGVVENRINDLLHVRIHKETWPLYIMITGID